MSAQRPRTLWQVLVAGVDVQPLLPQIAGWSTEELDMFHAEALDILESLATPAGAVPPEMVEGWAQTARTLALASVSSMGEAAQQQRRAVEAAYAAVGTRRPRAMSQIPVAQPSERALPPGFRSIGRVLPSWRR